MNIRTCLGLGLAALSAFVLPAHADDACALKDLRASTGLPQNAQTLHAWSKSCGDFIGRIDHSVTPLAFGLTLIAGGWDIGRDAFGGVEGRARSDALIYDQHTGQFIAPAGGGLWYARNGHSATRLTSGKVLIVGGGSIDYATADPSKTSEIFQPVQQTFVLGPVPLYPCGPGHRATLLNNGKVLLTGCANTTAQLYDPATNSFLPTGYMNVARGHHSATLLADGRVLVAGGYASGQYTNTAEIYDPATGTFTPTASMTMGRAYHAAARMLNGRVILGGGTSASAEIYDPARRTFSATGGMGLTTNTMPVAATLPDGKVIFGHDFFAEIYDPALGRFASAYWAYYGANSDAFAEGGSGALLSDGQFLWCGGDAGTWPPHANPDAYLFRAY